MQGVIQIYILLLAYTRRAAAGGRSKLQGRYSSIKSKLCCNFVSKSMKKEMNLFDSWFFSFVFLLTIAILWGGEGGEEKCYRGGVPRASDRFLPSSTKNVLEYHDKKKE